MMSLISFIINYNRASIEIRLHEDIFDARCHSYTIRFGNMGLEFRKGLPLEVIGLRILVFGG